MLHICAQLPHSQAHSQFLMLRTESWEWAWGRAYAHYTIPLALYETNVERWQIALLMLVLASLSSLNRHSQMEILPHLNRL